MRDVIRPVHARRPFSVAALGRGAPNWQDLRGPPSSAGSAMTATETPAAVPIIDCTPFTSDAHSEQRGETARAINEACEEYGFLVVTGHGIPEQTIEALRDVSLHFFAVPLV